MSKTKHKKLAAIMLTLIMLFGLSFSYNREVEAANIIKGDTYSNVVAVQTVLKKWGYYFGAVDGIFGSQTRAAVKYFQRKNGLVADGIVGSKTEAAMGLNLSRGSQASSRGKNIIKGDTAANIKAVQTVLKKWGYYFGAVDGIFGPKTRAAVQYFQRKNGLVADGIVGNKTEAAMGLNLGGRSYYASSVNASSNELYLLAKCVYAEARGEPYTGQVAIAAVVLNRVKDSRFPNTISGVIYQPQAFTAVADGQINLTPDQTAINAANDALNGWDPTYGCLYYYNPATATSKWIWSLPVVLKIGRHNFCKPA